MKGKSPIRKRRFHGRDVRAVIDTCVLIEATNPHDLYDEYGKLSGRPILPGTDTLDGSMRRGRARDGLLLLEYLQDRRIRTYFLGAEFMRQMAALVPPGDKEFPTHFARVFAHHAQQLLFPRWTTITDSGDAGKVGNDCDRHLVKMANWLGVPLITSETKANGAIRRAAARAGVRVVTPRQFWASRAHERALTRALLERWRRNEHKLWRRPRQG